ncbi:hypothetical protein KIPB_012100, partial [Kipferlia bialata]|eukprot:g12100.t1
MMTDDDFVVDIDSLVAMFRQCQKWESQGDVAGFSFGLHRVELQALYPAHGPKETAESFSVPVDYHFLATNSTFSRDTGLDRCSVLGHGVMTTLGQSSWKWVQRYGKIALHTSPPSSFTDVSVSMEGRFVVTAWSPRLNYFCTLFTQGPPNDDSHSGAVSLMYRQRGIAGMQTPQK